MEVILENIAAYGVILIVMIFILFIYLSKYKKRTRITSEKIEKAKELGFHEPVSLHPVVDSETCIGSGACVAACPEKDILGIISGQARTINASRCVGHGACFHACPVQAITLNIGTEKRGVELPHVSPEFETNIPGIFIAGELGGMGLIKNAVEQGKQAVEFITRRVKCDHKGEYDVIIVGAGPAGIAASLTAAKNGLRFLTLEQDSLGGTVFNFPRAKVVMTSTLDLPLYGKVKLFETSKTDLLNLWMEALGRNKILIHEQEKVLNIEKSGEIFRVETSKKIYTSNSVLLSIGRRGSPRKLGIPGENKEKVAYRLLEPELIHDQKILVVGGGDSAIENALLLSDEKNEVTLSYRNDSFARIKPKNLERIEKASKDRTIRVIFNSNVKEILDDKVIISIEGKENYLTLQNDLVYIFAGGEVPTAFLTKIGIMITKKFGDAILKHEN
ncbi:MAG TPA: NAD(P)-binding domain-containing protein [Ignavibacteriaceae bacterium]|nr:NAD(P)-binding domain-containing protein [Ignavibacteriaceae bacterium]